MSLHERILRMRVAQFVGRDKELALFRALLSPDSGGVLNIYGVGGIGKSTLLDQYIEITRGPDTLIGRVDGKDNTLILTIVEHQRVYSVLNLLEMLARQLGASGAYKSFFRNFLKEVKALRRLMRRLERRRLPDGQNAATLGKQFLAQAAGGATGGVSPDMQEYLQQQGYHLAKMESREYYDSARKLSTYMCAHYDDLATLVSSDHSFGLYLQNTYQNFYTTVLDAYRERTATKVLHDGDIVEVNANTGVVKVLYAAHTPDFQRAL